jgi:hypothetical protein
MENILIEVFFQTYRTPTELKLDRQYDNQNYLTHKSSLEFDGYYRKDPVWNNSTF